MKTTPGPWRFIPPAVRGNDTGYGGNSGDAEYEMGSVVGANDVVVCDFGNDAAYYPSAGYAPDPDDALLLIAGPTLLDALKALLSEAEDLHGIVCRERATCAADHEEDESLKNARAILTSFGAL